MAVKVHICLARTHARHTLWRGRESRRDGCPAPVFGGKASTLGALGGQELQRQSNRIPKSSPLQAGSRASHCPRPVKPPMWHQSQQTAPGTGQESEPCLQVATCPGPPSATSPSPTPEVASLQPQPGFPILPVQAGEGPLPFVKDLPHFLHLLTLHFPEQDIMGRATKGFRGF